MKPPDQMRKNIATTKDVAKLAGVSPATVSYVLNQDSEGSPRISAATQSRVHEAMAKLNYVPNMAGRNLRRLQSERICLCLPDIGRPYDNKLVMDLQKVADEKNYSLIITAGDTPARQAQVMKQLQRRLADGVILKYDEVKKEELQNLVRAQIALVIFTNRFEPDGFDIVSTNEEEASRDGVRYLIEKGHRRIGVITHQFKDPGQDVRLTGYFKSLDEAGIPVDPGIILLGADRSEAAYISAKKLLQLPQRPTAIFVSSDRAALSTMWAIRDSGLRIPEDVAVMGVGNIPEGHYSSPSLTTIGPSSLDFTEVANLLFSRLKEPGLKGREFLMRWEVIPRGSA